MISIKLMDTTITEAHLKTGTSTTISDWSLALAIVDSTALMMARVTIMTTRRAKGWTADGPSVDSGQRPNMDPYKT